MLMDLGYISDTEEWQKSAGFRGIVQQAISNSLKSGWSPRCLVPAFDGAD
jgi:hypothetical protein